jgi:hypothetical protein
VRRLVEQAAILVETFFIDGLGHTDS